MAAFSRGFYRTLHQHSLRLPSSLRAAVFTARPQSSLSQAPNRNFVSSTLRCYQGPARYPIKSTPTSIANSDPILRTVIQTRAPVLLYKEPSQRRYLWRIYSWATITTGIGLYNFYWVKHLPQEQPWFVPPTYIVIGVAFVAIGIHIFQRPVRRITMLEIIPGTMGGRLQLHMKVRKTPFAKESVVVADTWEATISEKTHPLVRELVEAERARKQSITEGLGHMFIVAQGWEIAARWLEQKWTSFFLKFKFAVLQFGIAEIEVDGVKWKIDCEGWLREEGKGKTRHSFQIYHC
jgi:hypothetical protein